MKRVRWWKVAVGIVVLAGAVWAACLVLGVGTGAAQAGSTRPACSQLPDAGAAADALAERRGLVDQITRTAPGARVTPTVTCEGKASLVTVTVADAAQAESVGEVIGRAEPGFGVPVEVVVG